MRPVESDDVETHGVIRVLRIPGEKHCGGAYQLALLVQIYGTGGSGETARSAVTHFDEHETIALEHDEIDFAEAATKILGNPFETVGQQMIARQLLPAMANGDRR